MRNSAVELYIGYILKEDGNKEIRVLERAGRAINSYP